jgi:exopolysaccharide biosynthesis polyprenyl glycosylphosphotransferase
MKPTHRRESVPSRHLHLLLDIGLNWLALVCAYGVKELSEIGIPTDPFAARHVAFTLAGIAVIWAAVTSALETYQYKRRVVADVHNLLTALGITVAVAMVVVYFLRPFVYPRWFTILYVILAAVFLAASRWIKLSVRQSLALRGKLVRKLVIIGDGDVARRLARVCERDHSLGYQFCGFVTARSNVHADGPPPDGLLGHLDDLESTLTEVAPHEVIVALPGREHERVLEIAHRCQQHSVRLRVVPDLFEVVMLRATVTEIEDIPLIGLRDPVITGYQSIVKRAFDVAVASFCLLIASPLLLVIPLLIWLDSRGRVFFIQERAGENGKPFRMYKFRSMVADAEARLKDLVDLDKLDEPAYKIPRDPRVTRVGRFLRRTSLDELPQLFNVLKGDMSIVGPRPEDAEVVKRYNLWHRKRLSVKPGITGPMQVNGRGDLALDERIRLELLYIADYSILTDVKYLLRTIPTVLRGSGAY